MKNIVVLFCLLVLPTAVTLLLNRLRKKQAVSLSFAARLGLALVMFITGLTHFTQTDGMIHFKPTQAKSSCYWTGRNWRALSTA